MRNVLVSTQEFSDLWDGRYSVMILESEILVKMWEVLTLKEVAEKGATGREMQATVQYIKADAPIFQRLMSDVKVQVLQIKPYKKLDPKANKHNKKLDVQL